VGRERARQRIGIGREDAGHVFDMFSRVTPNVDGTGIGLAVLQAVVEAHGGHIWVESADGGGSASASRFPPATRHGRILATSVASRERRRRSRDSSLRIGKFRPRSALLSLEREEKGNVVSAEQCRSLVAAL
jgi:hypothetical protein